MLRKLYKIANNKRDSDDGSGSFVLMLFSILMLILLMGMSVDILKNYSIKSSYSSQAQDSVDAAVMEVDARGGLGLKMDTVSGVPSSVSAVMEEYTRQKYGSYGNDIVGSEDFRRDSTEAYRSDACQTVNVKRYGDSAKTETRLPYAVITLDVDRRLGNDDSEKVVYEFVDGTYRQVDGRLDERTKYKVISASIVDSSMNVVLGTFGFPCQQYRSNVSAITFGSDGDLDR